MAKRKIVAKDVEDLQTTRAMTISAGTMEWEPKLGADVPNVGVEATVDPAQTGDPVGLKTEIDLLKIDSAELKAEAEQLKSETLVIKDPGGVRAVDGFKQDAFALKGEVELKAEDSLKLDPAGLKQDVMVKLEDTTVPRADPAAFKDELGLKAEEPGVSRTQVPDAAALKDDAGLKAEAAPTKAVPTVPDAPVGIFAKLLALFRVSR